MLGDAEAAERRYRRWGGALLPHAARSRHSNHFDPILAQSFKIIACFLNLSLLPSCGATPSLPFPFDVRHGEDSASLGCQSHGILLQYVASGVLG